MAPRKRDADATRSRLLSIATRVFAERGFDGARVDEIATKAGINKRMIYAYFDDKDGLYREVLAGYFAKIVELSQAGEAASPSPGEQAAVIVRRYFDFLAEHPRLVRLLAWEALSHDARARRVLVDSAAAGLEALRAVIRRGVAAGEFRADLDEKKTLSSVNLLVLGFFQQQRILEELWGQDLSQPRARQAVLAHLLDLVFHGVAAPARR